MSLFELGFWYVSRLRQARVTRRIHGFSEQGETLDGIVRLGTKKGARPKHDVRLIQFRFQGVLHTYISTVCHPQLLCLHDIVQLYARRWDLECACLTLKSHFGLALFWSAKTHVLLQQVWGTLIIAQLLQALRLQLAVQAHEDPFDVSLALLMAYLPTVSDYHPDALRLVVTRGKDLGFLRPSARIRIQIPDLTGVLSVPIPAGLILEQVPNYPADPGTARNRSPKKRKKNQASGHQKRSKKRAA